MIKAIFASPTYGMAYPQANNTHIAAIMHAGREGLVEWHGVASADRVGVVDARNVAANTARDNGYGIFWADADTAVEPAGFAKMARAGKDFVTAVGFQRVAPHRAMIGRFIKRKGTWRSQWICNIGENRLATVETTGWSMVYTSHDLLVKLGEDPFTPTEGLSEDLSFCFRAKKAGVQLWVDTSIHTWHLAEPLMVGRSYAEKYWRDNNIDQEALLNDVS